MWKRHNEHDVVSAVYPFPSDQLVLHKLKRQPVFLTIDSVEIRNIQHLLNGYGKKIVCTHIISMTDNQASVSPF